MRVHFLYRHIRLDKNEPFYIGIGTVPKRCLLRDISTDTYVRAYATRYRNKWWKNIVAKTEYEVEIIFESNNYELIKEKEKEFIKLHGRKDLGTGTLVNLTDGMEGVINKIFTPEIRANMGKARRGTKCSPENIEKARIGRNKYYEENLPKIFVYNKEGNFCGKYRGVSDAARNFDLSTTLAGNQLKGKIPHTKGYRLYLEYMGEQINPYIFKYKCKNK